MDLLDGDMLENFVDSHLGRAFLTMIKKERNECIIYYRVRPLAWDSYMLELPIVREQSVYNRYT